MYGNGCVCVQHYSTVLCDSVILCFNVLCSVVLHCVVFTLLCSFLLFHIVYCIALVHSKLVCVVL
jgi:hypothetical protein